MPTATDNAYAQVARIASPSSSEGLRKERAILLLWFLRNVWAIDDLDAYEYVCDGDNDQGVDALYVEGADGGDATDRLIIFQSKYPQSPKNVGINELKSFAGTAEQFRSRESVETMIAEGVEPELQRLLERLDVAKRLGEKSLTLRLVFVTAGVLTPDARRYAATLNRTHAPDYLTVYDVADLAPIIEAFQGPTTLKATVKVPCARKQRFVASLGSGRVAICSVRAADVVQWPGIKDRTLFDLNVRRELKTNVVRKALDEAIVRAVDHPNFLAFHNGLTVVCDKFDDTRPDRLVVTNLSVVNGAQSTVALYANRESLTDRLRIVVKFVEVPPDTQLAREVAVRSNTQNPVTTRNLRALDGAQLRLKREFDQYPDYSFETRPDSTLRAHGRVIQNDLAAQLLCAIFNEKPWLAMKRVSLFDGDTYPAIFRPSVTAAHVILVDRIGQLLDAAKDEFPEAYRRSWQLTRLVAAYLVGQILQTKTDLRAILDEPAVALRDTAALDAKLDGVVRFSAAVLGVRADQKSREHELDDFKVDFKRESTLRDLARGARDHYLTYRTMSLSKDSAPEPRAKKTKRRGAK